MVQISVDGEKLEGLLMGLGFPLEEYRQAGFQELEQMLDVRERFKECCMPDGSHGRIGDVTLYASAGFVGDLSAMVRLDEGGVDGEFAQILSEHGLKGNAAGMVDIARLVQLRDGGRNICQEFGRRAERIADSIIGVSVSGSERVYDWLNASKKLEQIRKDLADQIDPYHVALLGFYELSLDANNNERWLEVHRRMCDAERKGDHKLAKACADERILIEDKSLFAAYSLLKKQGEAVFRERYQLREGFAYDVDGKICKAPFRFLADPLEVK